ncbi:MAG TPA: CoA-binding protein [Anaerolineae bacterium]|nr:CoA-binding protein [Anaerolineae bacterium]
MDAIDRELLIIDFLNRRVWAIVGVSRDPEKFGHRVFCSLREAGYTVYPVNPNETDLDGIQVYPTLADLPERPEVVDVVVPPRVTEQIVRQMDALALDRIWMQPGAESQEAIEYCHEHGIAVVYDACAMIRRRQWN